MTSKAGHTSLRHQPVDELAWELGSDEPGQHARDGRDRQRDAERSAAPRTLSFNEALARELREDYLRRAVSMKMTWKRSLDASRAPDARWSLLAAMMASQPRTVRLMSGQA